MEFSEYSSEAVPAIVLWWNLLHKIYNRAHAGEVSFPGGRCDDGETVEETALRETHEELGIHYSDIDIWDKMRPVRDKTGNVQIPIGLKDF